VNIGRGEVLRRCADDGGRREGANCDKLEFAQQEIEVEVEPGGDTGEVDVGRGRLRPWHYVSNFLDIRSLSKDDEGEETYRKSCNSQTPVSP